MPVKCHRVSQTVYLAILQVDTSGQPAGAQGGSLGLVTVRLSLAHPKFTVTSALVLIALLRANSTADITARAALPTRCLGSQ